MRRKAAGLAVVAGFALAAASAPAAGAADLKVTKTDSADPVVRGDNLDYTILVENLGPDPAVNVVMTDKLPGGLDFRSTATGAGSCAKQGKTITCNLGTMAVAAKVTVTIRTRVTKRKGTIENTASVTSDTPDADSGNNSSTARTTVKLPSGPTCQGRAATIVGTAGANVINGTPASDVILAGAGDDQVFAGGGRDFVCAGSGLDLVAGGPKGDSVKGGLNADRIRGGRGADALRGNRGRDRLRGGLGADLLAGGLGLDRCRGGAGADTLRSCEF